jgi:peptidyl-prolyl cis-trans isomerase D
MLRGIHKASANWLGRVVMGVILGLIAISFAIWGVGDIFRGFGQSTLAKVGNTEIRIDQFRQTYQERLQQIGREMRRPITPDVARALGLDRQVLSRVIAETVLDERTKALGLGLTDAEIARRITEDPTFRGLSGQFDRGRFEQIIRQAGFTEARFLAEQRRELLRRQLLGSVGGDMIAPKLVLDAVNRYSNEQRSIDYVLLDRSQAGDVPEPSPEALAKYFEERKVAFRAPEYRKVVLLVLTPAELASAVEVSDADLRKAYEARRDRYATAERRHVQQIVFPNMEEAKAASEKIATGTTFAALAAERNLKDTDIDLGTLAKTAIVDTAVADAAFALKQGEVSQPVEGRFGIALVHVVKIEPGQTQPFEQVASQLKNDLANERARAEINTMHDKVEDERLGGASLADIAAKLNLKVRTIEAVDRSGRTPDGTQITGLPENVDVLSSAFTSEVGADNDPVRVPGTNGYVWYEVAEIKPGRERPLEEVKDQVLARWRDQEIATRLKVKSDEMVEKLKGGTSFAELAGAYKLTPAWISGLKRASPPPSIPARAVDQIFQTPKDGAGSAEGATATDRIVFKVNEIIVPTLDPQAAEVKRIEDGLRRVLAEELIGQYISRLEKEVGVTINPSALAQIVGGSQN